jgi:hypothetical protein
MDMLQIIKQEKEILKKQEKLKEANLRGILEASAVFLPLSSSKLMSTRFTAFSQISISSHSFPLSKWEGVGGVGAEWEDVVGVGKFTLFFSIFSRVSPVDALESNLRHITLNWHNMS